MLPTSLTSERLQLDPPVAADAAEVAAAVAHDSDILGWTTVPEPYSLEDAEEWIASVREAWKSDEQTGGDATWLIREVCSDSCPATPVIGAISVTCDGKVGEIAYWLTGSHRGKGYMTEAVGLVLDFAFETMSLEAILWRAVVRDGTPNWPSFKVVWRHGFTYGGLVRSACWHKGEARDCMLASLRKDDPREPLHAWRGPADNHPAFPDPRDPEALVRQFHDTYGLPIVEDGPNVDRDRIHMRLGLIAEEFAELIGAAYGQRARETLEAAWATAQEQDDHLRDTVEVADALGDLIYVIYGAALEFGIPLEDVLAEIQASNLSKLGADGKPIYREDGKVLKGPGYFPPDIRRVLGL